MSNIRTRILLSSVAAFIVAGLGMTYVRVSRAASEPPQAQQSPTLAPAPPQGRETEMPSMRPKGPAQQSSGTLVRVAMERSNQPPHLLSSKR